MSIKTWAVESASFFLQFDFKASKSLVFSIHLKSIYIAWKMYKLIIQVGIILLIHLFFTDSPPTHAGYCGASLLLTSLTDEHLNFEEVVQ